MIRPAAAFIVAMCFGLPVAVCLVWPFLVALVHLNDVKVCRAEPGPELHPPRGIPGQGPGWSNGPPPRALPGIAPVIPLFARVPGISSPLVFHERCECGRWAGLFDDVVLTQLGTCVYFLECAIVHRCPAPAPTKGVA